MPLLALHCSVPQRSSLAAFCSWNQLVCRESNIFTIKIDFQVSWLQRELETVTLSFLTYGKNEGCTTCYSSKLVTLETRGQQGLCDTELQQRALLLRSL